MTPQEIVDTNFGAEFHDFLLKTTRNYNLFIEFYQEIYNGQQFLPPPEGPGDEKSLKNIFDIPNCVFILAIDYDVVVKGLESKFGPKTKENERG